LRNRPVIQPFGLRRPEQGRDHDRAGRFAEDRHVAGVAAEGFDVALHPFERGNRIHHSVVAGGIAAGLARELRVREEAESAEAIVQRDDDGAFLRQTLAVVTGLRARAAREAAAIDPDHDGSAIVRRIGRRPNVQIKAIFSGRRWCRAARPTRAALHAARAEFGGIANAVPAGGRLRRLPAVLADRRRRERDAFEEPDVRTDTRRPAERAGIDSNLLRDRGLEAERSGEQSDRG
jgi:hypothetical protein